MHLSIESPHPIPDFGHEVEDEHHDSEGFFKRLSHAIESLNINLVQRHAHTEMYGVAKKIEESTGGFFEAIPEREMEENPPDSIKDYTYHKPNPRNIGEVDAALGLLDAFLGDDKPALLDEFNRAWAHHSLAERVENGQTIIVASNHSVFQDQGYHIGLNTLAAREEGSIQYPHSFQGVLMGKTLGYLKVGGMNVSDDILRKVGFTLFTFPVSGGEAVRHDVFDPQDMDLALKRYRKTVNAEVRSVISQKVQSTQGGFIFLTPNATPDEADGLGNLTHSTIDESTRNMLFDAAQNGAGILPMYSYFAGEHNYARIGDRMFTAMDFDGPDDIHAIGKYTEKLGLRVRGKHEDIDPQMRGDVEYPSE